MTGPVAPPSVPTEVVGPIVLGTEFGPVSAAAETVAIERARQDGVALVIVNAIDPGWLRLPGGRFRQRIDQVRQTRERAAEPLLRRAVAAGVQPQLLIWEGEPVTSLIEAARAEGGSRIIIGSHGRGRLGRAIAGSVSSLVAAQADCPVDIVSADGTRQNVVSVVTVAPVFRRL
jgi:nucleotide-binding universal stress UspA family protein